MPKSLMSKSIDMKTFFFLIIIKWDPWFYIIVVRYCFKSPSSYGIVCIDSYLI